MGVFSSRGAVWSLRTSHPPSRDTISSSLQARDEAVMDVEYNLDNLFNFRE